MENWDDGPSFVETTRVMDETNSVPVAGCDDHTYYLGSSAAAQLASARAEGAIVHLHKRPSGEPVDTAPIRCLLP